MWLYRCLILFGLIASVTAANATTITVVLDFEDPASEWSGILTYDDAFGVPYLFEPLLTIHALTSMQISNGTAVWDETEIDDPLNLPNGPGLLEDVNGRFFALLAAADTETGAGLGSFARIEFV
jgi:hypothetical protein